MKKSFILAILFSVLVIAPTPVFATQLPVVMQKFIRQELPNANIRFDALITLEDGTIYLPVIPSLEQKVDKLSILYTYPKGANLSKNPDMIVFNNNYSLLKLIKTKDAKLTVMNLEDMPMVIKTGLLPQDLLVPSGLILPDILESILGNLVIPTSNEIKIDKLTAQNSVKIIPANNTIKTVSSDVKNVNIKTDDVLKNKLYFVSNFDSNILTVFSPQNSQPLYSLELSSIPKDVKPIYNDKFLLVATNNKTYVDLVDVQEERIVKQIDLATQPNEIVSNKSSDGSGADLVYVACTKDGSIFTIDLKEMKLKEKIKVKGMPEKLTISPDGKKLAYADRLTSDVYTLELGEKNVNKLVMNVANISKLLLDENNLYVLSRTKNILMVNDLRDLKVEIEKSVTNAKNTPTLKTFWKVEEQIPPVVANDEALIVELGKKPVDMMLYKDKIFVLCALNNQIYVVNTQSNSVERVIKLPLNGFSTQMVEVPNNRGNMVIISNVVEKKYVLFDLEKQKVVQILPIEIPVGSLRVVDKVPAL